MQTGQEKLGMQTVEPVAGDAVHEAADHARDGDERVVELKDELQDNDQPRRRRRRRRRACDRPAAAGAPTGRR